MPCMYHMIATCGQVAYFSPIKIYVRGLLLDYQKHAPPTTRNGSLADRHNTPLFIVFLRFNDSGKSFCLELVSFRLENGDGVWSCVDYNTQPGERQRISCAPVCWKPLFGGAGLLSPVNEGPGTALPGWDTQEPAALDNAGMWHTGVRFGRAPLPAPRRVFGRARARRPSVASP